MAGIFISYSRKDQAFVHRLHDALIAQNHDVWVDWEDIPLTAEWLAEIYDGIEKADTFISVLSPDYLTSENCNKELDHTKFNDLNNAIHTDLDWARAHTRLLVRAIEWDTKKRNGAFLLRGADLRAAEKWLAQATAGKEPKPTSLQGEYIHSMCNFFVTLSVARSLHSSKRILAAKSAARNAKLHIRLYTS